MRNPDTPMKTAKLLRDNGYQVHAAIIAVHPKITELGVYARFNKEVTLYGDGRLADINSHNDACVNLLTSADKLHETKCVDSIHIYATYPLREIHALNIKDNTWDNPELPSTYIREERERQMKDEIFLSDRIKAGRKLSKTINPVLRLKVEKIVGDIRLFQIESNAAKFRIK